MKRRHRVRRRSESRPQLLPIFANRSKRKRKTFSFERLEERFAFSATQAGISNDTPEGAAAILQRELEWAAIQTASVYGAMPEYTFLALPDDPMFANQWHLWNTGQEVGVPDLQHLFGIPGEDLNVLPVWQGTGLERSYTGAGVSVAVFDSGIQLLHPDLAANIHPTLRFNATNGTSGASPSLFDPTGYHGTAVAGLIGAVANNNEGGSGVAPGVTLIPIRRDFQNDLEETRGFQWVNRFDFDITNNSWGPNHGDNRGATPLSATELEILRNSITHGRGGLGIIHVFASGNDGGPNIPGYGAVGNYDSASYNAWVNSRYTIGVTGVDHDGLYLNYDQNGLADGTFTTYPTAGPSVLVAAPTGSNGAITIADDDGYGSGLWTTDLVGDFGANSEPEPGTGFDPDQDPWADPDYTSRFNGTSGAAPLVSGVIALMLEANPNLTWRDVQEILVRTARQNAQFEFPFQPGAPGNNNDFAPQNTWQVNQIGPFRNPDPWTYSGQSASQAIFDPLATPNPPTASGPTPDPNFTFDFTEFPGSALQNMAPDTYDTSRQLRAHYEAQPPLYTNGSGYTVSQGYGVYGEQIGYGHGIIDAALAVEFAEKWHTGRIAQNINANTERTFTTGPVGPGLGFTFGIVPAAQMPQDLGGLVVPGGFSTDAGFIGYWNEYFADPPRPFDPANVDSWPSNSRGASYLDFAVPPAQGIDVEWVEVKMQISGGAADLDSLRIFLVSPDGTQSELNNFYLDTDFAPDYTTQPGAQPVRAINPLGDIDVDGGDFTWTFSTNRHWGESSASSIIIEPVSGEPLLSDIQPISQGDKRPIFRNWELHIENYSNTNYGLDSIEVIWHGKPVAGGQLDQRASQNITYLDYAASGIGRAQRIQGFVGLDTNADNEFNYNRYIQTVEDPDGDPNTTRVSDIRRVLDFTDINGDGLYDPAEDTINQEPFAENVLVELFVVNNGVVDQFPIDQFLTGDDGNYYFDVDPTKTYEVRVSDLNAVPGVALNHVFAPGTVPFGLQYQPHYLSSWRITPDWFYAPDRDNDNRPSIDNPGEILFGMFDSNGDGTATLAPKPFTNQGNSDGVLSPTTTPNRPIGYVDPIPMAVKNINFLLKREAPSDEVVVEGTVYADLDADGAFTPSLDTPIPNVRVYLDINGDGQFQQGTEPFRITAADGSYDPFVVEATTATIVKVGVDPTFGTTAWEPTTPGGLSKSVIATPGDFPSIIDFFVLPPATAPGGQTGNILGFVFDDLDGDGIKVAGELGIEGMLVFVDTNENGIWDNDNDGTLESGEEIGTFTTANGSFFLNDVESGNIHVTVELDGTTYASTVPANGVRQVILGPGLTKSGVMLGVKNLADKDWGDLPSSYSTLAGGSPAGPSHVVYPHFRLGSNVNGEVDGKPSANANLDTADDGISLVNGVLSPGDNLVRVTVFGVGGSLTGWIDWNNDGHFTEGERLTWRTTTGTVLGGEADLTPGTHDLIITSPGVTGQLAARFRWGEKGLTFNGAATIGEVEDYIFASSSVEVLPGDYNDDGAVNMGDYVVWRKFAGTATVLANDLSPGTVDNSDYLLWRQYFGATSGGGSAEAGGAGSGSDAAVAAPWYSLAGLPVVSKDAWFATASTPPASANGGAQGVYDTGGGSAAVVSPAAIDAAVSIAPASSTTPAKLPRNTATAVANATDANLLLLDQILTDLSAADEQAPLYNRFSAEEDSVGDLELAAAFEDESAWWSI